MQAVIIGAGLGGLGTGIHLARQGWDVTVLERNDTAGGRMNRIAADSFRIDTGPTLLMMPEVIEGIFAACGRRMEDYLRIRRLDPSYEIRFSDGSRLPMRRAEEMPREFARFNARDAGRFPALLRDMERKYHNARGRFIERSFNSLADLFHPTTLAGFARSLPMESAWSYVSRYCDDHRLRQALTFQSLYLGTSPLECPSIYGFLPFIEMEFGVWFPEGGMYAVAEALTRLFRELGGRLELGARVRKIEVEHGRAVGVELEDGGRHRADAVISNCDVQTTYTQLVEPEHRPHNTDARMWRRESGCGGYLLYLGVKRVPDDWLHHTVLLPHDYEGVMADLFRRRCVPREPAIYACVPTLSDPSLAPPGHHVLYVLAPSPHLDCHIDWAAAAPLMRERCFRALEAAGWDGLESDIVFERQWTPADFLHRYELFRGSAFGLSCLFNQSAYWRPHNRSEDVPGLYLVGASTHPGGGVPIVLTSARLVAEAVTADAARARGRRALGAARPARRRAAAGAE
ncbi:MAG: phytoene desaturase family protein [Armatimonadota bacterium]